MFDLTALSYDEWVEHNGQVIDRGEGIRILLARIAKVEALHQPFSSGEDCQECSGSHGADPTGWPCDTILAFEGDCDGR